MREIEPLVLQIKNRGFGQVLLDLLGGDHRAVVVSTAERQILESISIQTVLLKYLERRSATSTLFKSENGKFVFYHLILAWRRPTIEPREHCGPQVVLRKIMGTLRNEKGISIHERIMTALATWGQRGLNSLQMLMDRLAC